MPHGGNLDAARQLFPDACQPWIDLSTGINPVPYPVPLLPATAWSALPTAAEELELRRAAASCYRVQEVGQIVSAPGTQSLIQMLPQLIAPDEVAVLGPTYEEHALCWRRSQHRVSVVPDLEAAADARVVVVVNPNNPTGRIVAASDLRKMADQLAERGGLLVVDEAFADASPQTESLGPDLPQNAVVLRSFGKFYGLAGLRLGFAIAHPELAERLRAALGPWCVSGPAIAIGCQALTDKSWQEETRARLLRDTKRLHELLDTAGFKIRGACGLFTLAAHPDAGLCAQRLGAEGVHIRVFPSEPSWIRFGLPGEDEAWMRLSRALENPTPAAKKDPDLGIEAMPGSTRAL